MGKSRVGKCTDDRELYRVHNMEGWDESGGTFPIRPRGDDPRVSRQIRGDRILQGIT